MSALTIVNSIVPDNYHITEASYVETPINPIGYKVFEKNSAIVYVKQNDNDCYQGTVVYGTAKVYVKNI